MNKLIVYWTLEKHSDIAVNRNILVNALRPDWLDIHLLPVVEDYPVNIWTRRKHKFIKKDDFVTRGKSVSVHVCATTLIDNLIILCSAPSSVQISHLKKSLALQKLSGIKNNYS